MDNAYSIGRTHKRFSHLWKIQQDQLVVYSTNFTRNNTNCELEQNAAATFEAKPTFGLSTTSAKRILIILTFLIILLIPNLLLQLGSNLMYGLTIPTRTEPLLYMTIRFARTPDVILMLRINLIHTLTTQTPGPIMWTTDLSSPTSRIIEAARIIAADVNLPVLEALRQPIV